MHQGEIDTATLRRMQRRQRIMPVGALERWGVGHRAADCTPAAEPASFQERKDFGKTCPAVSWHEGFSSTRSSKKVSRDWRLDGAAGDRENSRYIPDVAGLCKEGQSGVRKREAGTGGYEPPQEGAQ